MPGYTHDLPMVCTNMDCDRADDVIDVPHTPFVRHRGTAYQPAIEPLCKGCGSRLRYLADVQVGA